MRFGIALQSNKTPAEYVAQATSIDRYPFDVVSVYNDLFFQPALGPLLLMAPHLRTAQLGPAALNPYTVHPIEIAGQIAVLDLATQGRAYLGLARGSWLDQLGIVQRRPIQTLRECVLLVRHLFGKQTGGFHGQIFNLSPGQTLSYDVVRESVPITIGTWGPRTARLAGELADEVKIGGSANPAMAAYLRECIYAGEAAAGRPKGTVGVCLGAVTVVDADRARARAAARREVAMYVPVVAPLDPTLRDAEWLGRIAALAARGDFRRSPTSSPTPSWIAWPSPARPLTWCARWRIWRARGDARRVRHAPRPRPARRHSLARRAGATVVPHLKRLGDAYGGCEQRVSLRHDRHLRALRSAGHDRGDPRPLYVRPRGGRLVRGAGWQAQPAARAGAFACTRCSPRCHCCPPSSGRSRPTTG